MQETTGAATILDRILEDVRSEVSTARAARPPGEIRRMLADAPPVRSVPDALGQGFSIMAEIKSRSPSVGSMRPENVSEAPLAYAESPFVRAVSVLTNRTHFGQDISFLSRYRDVIGKPVLRKDFILDEYQVMEARAFGADALLLMASVLDSARLRGFYDLARELGMQALFEVHNREELATLPADAVLIGINSRKFQVTGGFTMEGQDLAKDFTTDLTAFELVSELPDGCLRVAESGISPATMGVVLGRFDAALIGTSLLRDERGIHAALADFENACQASTV